MLQQLLVANVGIDSLPSCCSDPRAEVTQNDEKEDAEVALAFENSDEIRNFTPNNEAPISRLLDPPDLPNIMNCAQKTDPEERAQNGDSQSTESLPCCSPSPVSYFYTPPQTPNELSQAKFCDTYSEQELSVKNAREGTPQSCDDRPAPACDKMSSAQLSHAALGPKDKHDLHQKEDKNCLTDALIPEEHVLLTAKTEPIRQDHLCTCEDRENMSDRQFSSCGEKRARQQSIRFTATPGEFSKPKRANLTTKNMATQSDKWDPENKRLKAPPSPGLSKSPFIILLLYLLTGFLATGLAKETKYPFPMICPESHPRTLFQLENPPKCKPMQSSDKTPVPLTLQLYKQNLILYKSQAHHCIITRRIAKTLTYFFNDEHLKKEDHYLIEVSQAECLQMLRSKTCRFGKLTRQTDGAFATSNRDPPKFEWCCKWFTYIQTNCHLVPATIYKRHGVAFTESTAGDTSHCKYTSGNCRLRDKTRIIWTPDTRANCKFQQYRNATGKFWNNHWVADKLQLLLTFQNNSFFTDCNDTQLLKSDQGVYVKNFNISEDESPPNNTAVFNTTDSPPPTRFRRQVFEYQGAMRQFDAQVLANYTRHAFTLAAMNLCKHSETIFWILQALIAANPTKAMRQILRTHYVQATGVGNLIEVVRCIPIENFTIENANACEKGVLISYAYNEFRYTHLMDPSDNIIQLDKKVSVSKHCYRASHEVCINESCYHVARTHTRVTVSYTHLTLPTILLV